MRSSLSGNFNKRKKVTNRFRSRSLGAAAGGLGAAGLSPTSAEAGIHYDLNANAGPGDSISLLLPQQADFANSRINIVLDVATGGMSMGEISLGFGDTAIQFVGQPGLDSMGMASMGMDAWHSLKDFGVGETVDGTLSSAYAGQPFGYVMNKGVTAPGWGNASTGTTNYAGFQFSIDGVPVFGWMKITVDSNTFTLDQWGYDNTGAGIEVGAIPEPSTALLLGLGLAGLAAVSAKARKRITERIHGDQP